MTRSTRSTRTSALSQLNSSLRIKPVAAAVSFALLSAQMAYAQDQAAAEGALEEVTVTGSRIQAAVGMATPTPVTAISTDELKTMSATNITAALTQLPQFFNSQTAENFGGGGNGFFTSPGGGSSNLRGIGSSRTLTLLDSRRMPPASIFGGADINTFPDQLLKRVEIVTGGASAQYGTDAVSGVVNYILDKQFEGVRVGAQFGQTFRGDGTNTKYSLSLGHALTDKIHLLFAATSSSQNAINSLNGRSWYRSCGLMQNPNIATGEGATAPSTTSVSNPFYVADCNLRPGNSSIDGILTSTAAGFPKMTFDSRGNATPFLSGSKATADGSIQVGGSGEDPNTILNVLLPSQDLKTFFARLDFQLTDDMTFWVEGQHAEQQLERNVLIGFYNTTFGHQPTIYNDNAFLPASVKQQMTSAGITSASLLRQIGPADGSIGSVLNDQKTNVATLGLDMTIAGSWKLNTYGQLGTTDLDAAQIGYARQDRVYLAVDAVTDSTGTIRCRVNTTGNGTTTPYTYTPRVPDCVPLNLFGRGGPSASAFDWITGFDPNVPVTTIPYLASSKSYSSEAYQYMGDAAKHRIVAIEQRLAEFVASGEIVDTWAGTITAAIGANYRREDVKQRVHAPQGNPSADPLYYPVWCNDTDLTNFQCSRQVTNGIRPGGNINVRGVPVGVETNLVEIQTSNVPNIEGHFAVKEAFAETLIPLMKDLSWMKDMNISLAGRIADYEGSGNISSYKGGLNLTFTDEVRVRGTFSHDTRAGNIADRFDRTGGAAAVTDRITGPTPSGLPARTGSYNPTTVTDGNPNILPEEGDTFTVGVIYRPEWLSGFDMSVDYLNVTLKKAIQTPGGQAIVDDCYLRNDQSACSKIVRGSGVVPIQGNVDFITFLQIGVLNLGSQKFNGVDIEFGYTTPIEIFGGGERISARVIGTRLLEASTTTLAGVTTDNTGSVPLQYFKWKANIFLNYTRGDFGFGLTGRFNSGGNINNTYNVPRYDAPSGQLKQFWHVQDNDVGSSIYWDSRLTYRLPVGAADLELFGNIQNLLDKDPIYILGPGVGNQTVGGYDQIGRRFVIGANVKF